MVLKPTLPLHLTYLVVLHCFFFFVGALFWSPEVFISCIIDCIAMAASNERGLHEISLVLPEAFKLAPRGLPG